MKYQLSPVNREKRNEDYEHWTKQLKKRELGSLLSSEKVGGCNDRTF